MQTRERIHIASEGDVSRGNEGLGIGWQTTRTATSVAISQRTPREARDAAKAALDDGTLDQAEYDLFMRHNALFEKYHSAECRFYGSFDKDTDEPRIEMVLEFQFRAEHPERLEQVTALAEKHGFTMVESGWPPDEDDLVRRDAQAWVQDASICRIGAMKYGFLADLEDAELTGDLCLVW